MPVHVPDYVAGSKVTDPDRHADNLLRMAGWVRRRLNEIDADAAGVDVGSLFALNTDCFRIKEIIDLYRAGDDIGTLKEALITKTREIAIGNPTKTPAEIQADWAPFYQAVSQFLSWSSANLPAEGEQIANATVTVRRRWPQADFIIRAGKPPALVNALANLRATIVD